MPPTSFGYLRRSANTRPVRTRSGENTRWKPSPATSPEPCSSIGRVAGAGGADRQGGLVGDKRARLADPRDRLRGCVHPAEVRAALLVDEQRNDHDDCLGLRRPRLRCRSSR